MLRRLTGAGTVLWGAAFTLDVGYFLVSLTHCGCGAHLKPESLQVSHKVFDLLGHLRPVIFGFYPQGDTGLVRPVNGGEHERGGVLTVEVYGAGAVRDEVVIGGAFGSGEANIYFVGGGGVAVDEAVQFVGGRVVPVAYNHAFGGVGAGALEGSSADLFEYLVFGDGDAGEGIRLAHRSIISRVSKP